MELLLDFVMPVATTNANNRESKYLSNAQLAFIKALPVGGACLLPAIAGISNQHKTVRNVLANRLGRGLSGKTPEFQVGLMPDGQVAVKKVAEIVETPAETTT